MRNGIYVLAAAIIFATTVLAVMLRYEVVANGAVRHDRWTGRVEMQCSEGGWLNQDECDSFFRRQQSQTAR